MNKVVSYILVIAATAILTALLIAFLLNIRQRKEEGKYRHIDVVTLNEETVDPAIWGRNYPREYDGYKKTELSSHTHYGGSEGISKLETDSRLKIIFAGYPFGVDYNPRRGHYYSLIDQQASLRARNFKQVGSCLQCHAGGLKTINEKAGRGDMMAGFQKICKMPLKEAWGYAKHPVACLDCHDPKTMELRVTRPAFLKAVKIIKEKEEGVKNYDPNTVATVQEMRTFVCAQCHVTYYCGPKAALFYPWNNGLKVEEIESYFDNYKFPDGHRFFDWKHKISGAQVIKAKHPEFELWSQGVHAKAGVACADCHMPYMRQGAAKVTDHYIRSPLLNVNRACLQCHHFTEEDMLSRVKRIQDTNRHLLDLAEDALVNLINKLGQIKEEATQQELAPIYELQRKAQWRVDFVNAENSMGFHAPQEAARILAEAIDYARQGEVMAQSITVFEKKGRRRVII